MHSFPCRMVFGTAPRDLTCEWSYWPAFFSWDDDSSSAASAVLLLYLSDLEALQSLTLSYNTMAFTEDLENPDLVSSLLSDWTASILSQTLHHTALERITLFFEMLPVWKSGAILTIVLLQLMRRSDVVSAASRVRHFVCDIARGPLDPHSDFGLWTRHLRVRIPGLKTRLSLKLRGPLEGKIRHVAASIGTTSRMLTDLFCVPTIECGWIPYGFLRHSRVEVLGGTGGPLEDDLGLEIYDPLIIDTVLDVPSTSEEEPQPDGAGDAGESDSEQGPSVTHYYSQGTPAKGVESETSNYYQDRI
ncbi:hypothetical protein OH77DRAFT_1234208 [Trametes cingulata]|nr:hypothetical protein OH77DRAFT_1234208 [Trametes cingulata]